MTRVSPCEVDHRNTTTETHPLNTSLINLAFVAAVAAFSTLAHAQAWPAKPVKIIVPYPPGGAVDVVTRKMAAKLQEIGRAHV